MKRSILRRAAVLSALVALVVLASGVAPLFENSSGHPSSHSSPGSIVPFVPPTERPSKPPSAATAGPHPGTLDVYETAPGGATTEDPSAAYDTVSFEPIYNVYQTLVTYNGSSTSAIVPELATCVPGSTECSRLYGSSLIADNATTGLPQYFTFVLDSAARFYDPSTGNSWGVYPSDVMFSISRTISFADQPGVGSQPGWIQAQALVQHGGYGIHSPYNNTPASVLQSMLVNDSAFCPAVAMTSGNGCITFNAVGSGSDWPFFLQLVADPLGASVEPCGWYTYVGAGLPGFTGAGQNVTDGDGPCLLPGGAHSTSDASFQHFVSTVAPSSWDAVQLAAAANPNNPQPAVQWSMVGSGPYYAAELAKQIGYVLKANPAYRAPTGCAGSPGCEPLPGTYQGTVNVYWERDDTAGIAEYQAGQADFADIQLPTHVSTLTSLLRAGKIDLTSIPTLSIFFQSFNLDFNVSQLNSLGGNPGVTNVPGDFFDAIAARELVARSYPYATINASLLNPGNISTGFDYGGAIPKYLGDYYAYNISWPSGNPNLDPSTTDSAAWWWTQGTNASSPYYDSQLANCTASTPCTFAFVNVGSSFYGTADGLLASEISSITGGRVAPYVFNSSFPSICRFFSPIPCDPLPLEMLGWAPDYPDPTDYVIPMYYPDSTYTYGNAVAGQLGLPQYNDPSCMYAINYSTARSAWAALVYYHGLTVLPDACQGIAFNISAFWYRVAASLPIGPERTLEYQMASQLDNLLTLYLWDFQNVLPETYAPWIEPSSLNTNPLIGGAGVQSWYTVGYSSATSYATFTETGLPLGTSWSVTVGGSTSSSTSPSLTLLLPRASYNFSVGFVPGNLVSPAAGSVDLSGGSSSVAVNFTAFARSTAVPLTLSATGLQTGTRWSVLLTGDPPTGTFPSANVPGLGEVKTQGQAMTLLVPPLTSFDFGASMAIGYSLSEGSGTLSTGTAGAVHEFIYAPLSFYTYGVRFAESGLFRGAAWTVTLNGVTQTTTAPNVTFYLPNGSYRVSAAAFDWRAHLLNGSSYLLNGSSLPQGSVVNTATIAFTFLGFVVNFTESGLPPTAGNWTVSVNGVSQSANSATSTLTFDFPSSTQAVTYLVSAPPNYAVQPSSGTLTMNASYLLVNLTFVTTLGALTFTALPTGGYNLWVSGQPVITGGTNSSYTIQGVEQGVVPYEVVAPGYYPLFGNATIVGGKTTTIAVGSALIPLTSSPPPLWTTTETLILVVTGVLGAIVVVAVVVYGRKGGGRSQPPTQGEDPPRSPASPPPR